MLDDKQLAAVAARYPDTVEVSRFGAGLLEDQDNGADYAPLNLRDALGWIAAGEWDSDGTNPCTTRLANHWHRKGWQ